MARPTKLTSEVTKRICDAIQLGATYEHAAQYGGVTYRAMRNWVQRGENEIERRDNPRVVEGTQKWNTEEPFVQFFQDIKDAEAKAVIGWLAKIEKAANEGTWQAAAWKAERRYPGIYGKQVQEHKHIGKVNHTFTIDDFMKAQSDLRQWQADDSNGNTDTD